ncbi:geranylgeranylglyceryl/heptaprenylglyceryl phosphate synthase [Spirosoma sp. KCTC 42546]|uniref:geranylgeranylglyceryl/heptaprenylglyceryl phosphate synthase n=1 Tax=Spirosoma sp. KCTC 42546 TaxID=2520506 RepID=UPI00115A5928|nr:geranylgeranylglyceryl/heptaprenylglyceryl phosphate synthase [Spirosoma sp. KCTC 42546]QDK83583.1 geranylgeranylglyceryl/heptaprenylglyceryl phosphate synthase [Spirosoma sp. KCTC 42546]
MTILRTNRLSGQKSIGVLLDPDKIEQDSLINLLTQTAEYPIDFFLVGGSLVTDYLHKELIAVIRSHTNTPIILFPGNPLHIEPSADAILFLSLISGRNPEFLIGQHVIAAPLLKKSGLEILPTGYMVVDSGTQTTVSYISGTMPLPHDKPGVAACTAMAGEMLGLQLMYLDAGSGARRPVSPEMIAAVRSVIELPIIVGGGINSGEKAYQALKAGADMIVIGNGIEQDPDLLPQLSTVVREFNQSVVRA